MIARRGFITGALALLATPVIVRAEGLMKVAPTSVILPEHRFDTRILVDYDIATDSALLRVDRKLGRLIRPPHVMEASLAYAKAKLGDNHPIFDVQPGPGEQKYAMVQLGNGVHDYTRWAAAFSEPSAWSSRILNRSRGCTTGDDHETVLPCCGSTCRSASCNLARRH